MKNMFKIINMPTSQWLISALKKNKQNQMYV